MCVCAHIEWSLCAYIEWGWEWGPIAPEQTPADPGWRNGRFGIEMGVNGQSLGRQNSVQLKQTQSIQCWGKIIHREHVLG